MLIVVILLRKFKEQWEKWDLRSFILLSLFLQVFINIFAPLRKRTKNATITALIWISYLLSDWAANYAVALISSSQNEVSPKNSRSSSSNNNNSDLLAFWAPFLMVHLGGPDTITALAVEDNKLWLRHLFSLIFQSLAAIYVFVQSLPDNQLLIPTVLMFISGLYRYTERLVSLYSATSDSDAGPDYARLMEELQSKLEANLPVYIEMIPVNDEGKSINPRVKTEDLSDTEVVLYAHKFFNFLNLRDLDADLIIGVRERKRFRDFFLMRGAKDAFKVIEVELNFIYEVLFTKVSGVYNKSGYCRRFISFALVVASFLLFHFEDKKDFKSADVGITYTLLIGAIVLDITAFIRIFTSDWFIAKTKKLTETTSSQKKTKKPDCGFFHKIFPMLGRRWSGYVSTYNLISCCLKRSDKKMDKFIEMLDLTDFFDSRRNVKSQRFDEKLREHIFQELHMKSEIADDLDTAKEISSARGDWILRFRHCGKLLHHVVDMDFDQSLLIWHIATEICYHDQEISNRENKFRDFSKLLSDYMVYLLIKQPAMMSAVSGIGQIRFRDTCAEAKMFFQDDSETMNKRELEPEPSDFQVITYVVSMFFKRLLSSPYNLLCFVVDFFIGFFVGPIVKCVTGRGEMMKRRVDRYCSKDTGDEMRSLEEKFSKKILGVHTEVEPVVIKGDRSKSVLFDGCILAKEMIGMGNNKWEIMSEVWVEMLCYAAMRCTPNTHAIELSKGGELVTIVWLLMIHFGFGKKFNDSGGHLRANIIGAK